MVFILYIFLSLFLVSTKLMDVIREYECVPNEPNQLMSLNTRQPLDINMTNVHMFKNNRAKKLKFCKSVFGKMENSVENPPHFRSFSMYIEPVCVYKYFFYS